MLKPSRLVIFILYALLAFPAFYFVYKFVDVSDIAHDFFQYYRLYNNWDWHNVNAPFNMRLFSSYLVFLQTKLGIYYQTASAFDHYVGYGFNKLVYFNAILFNYLCVVLTSTGIYGILFSELKNRALAFTGGLLYLLGFGTIFYELTPCTDAFSTVLFLATWHVYRRKSPWIYVLLLAAIFQREYILMVMALLPLLEYARSKQKYLLKVSLCSIVCFGMYFLLRRTYFYTPALSFQTNFGSLWQAFLHPDFSLSAFVKSLDLTLNIYFVYMGIVFYKWRKRISIQRYAFYNINVLMLQIVLISFAASLGNNAGRYFYMLSPMIIYYAVVEASAIVGYKSEELS